MDDRRSTLRRHWRWLLAAACNIFLYPVAVTTAIAVPIVAYETAPATRVKYQASPGCTEVAVHHALGLVRPFILAGGITFGIAALALAGFWSAYLYKANPL